MSIRGYPERNGNSDAEYILAFSNEDLENGRVIQAGTNIEIDLSSPGLLIVNASGGDTTSPYVTWQNAPNLSGDRILTAGNNITLDVGIAGQIVLNAQATGGGASTTNSYIVANPEGSLSNERVLTPGQGITITDNTTTIDVGISPTLLGYPFLTLGSAPILTGERTLTIAGGLAYSDLGPNSTFTISASPLLEPEYIVSTASTTLTNERVITAGDNIQIVPSSGLLTVSATSIPIEDITGNYTTIGCTVGGASAVLSPGEIALFPVDFSGTIENWTVLSDTANSSAVAQIYKSTYSGYPTMSAITGTDKPTISSGVKAQSTALTGWTTSISSGDIFKFILESVTNAQTLTITLRVKKTG